MQKLIAKDPYTKKPQQQKCLSMHAWKQKGSSPQKYEKLQLAFLEVPEHLGAS
jgi:hypothetical protein